VVGPRGFRFSREIAIAKPGLDVPLRYSWSGGRRP
jgi:hypothetical protein